MLHRSSEGSRASSRVGLRRVVHVAAALGAGALFLALPSTASAAGITLNTGKMQPGRTETRTDASLLYYISKKDCDEDIDFPFSITFDAVSGSQQLEVWAGDGTHQCITNDARYGSTKESCHLIYTEVIQSNSKELLWTPGASLIANAHGSVDECTVTSPSPLGITLSFLQLDAGNATDEPIASVTWEKTKIQLRAPDPPTVTGITGGEGALTLKIGAVDTVTQGYIQKYALFCDPPPSSAASSGCGCANAGATSTTTTTTTTTTTSTGGSTNPPPPQGGQGGDASPPPPGFGGTTTGGTAGTGGATGGGGTGGGGTAGGGGTCTANEHTPDSCQSCILVPGATTFGEDSEYLCGSTTNAAATELPTDTLENGTSYAVAVAIIDKVGNVGPLSTLECDSPAEVSDFYESYRGRGGTAGGGLCAMRPAARDTGVLAPFGAGLALLVLGGRRLARRRRDPKEPRPLPRGNGEAR